MISLLKFHRASAADFAYNVEDLRLSSPLHAENLDSAGDLAAYGPDAEFYLTADASSGFAIVNGDMLKFVFSTVRGRGDSIVAAAVKRGARRLDCFEGHLSELYARHGFEIVSRIPNWDENGPDVVDMVRAA